MIQNGKSRRDLFRYSLGGLLATLRPTRGRAAPGTQHVAGRTMGTYYRVTVAASRLQQAELAAGVARRLDEVDAAMSTWRSDSELSRFNARATTDWVAITPELHMVLQTAAAIGALTEGAFDVTVGPLVNLWGFGPEPRRGSPPPAAALAAARARVGQRLLQLTEDPPRLRKTRPDVYVNLSGIAKGYAVDRIAAWLAATGHRDFLIEVGGEIRGRGARADGAPWRVGVSRPEPGSDGIARVLAVHDTALATSGDYRQYFVFEGRRLSHEIDPTTGRPIAHALASVTVLDAACMRADALATGLLVLGPARGPALARRLGLSALFLIQRGDGFEAVTTGGFPAAE